MKDLFSEQSRQYKKFRPSYPEALFEFLFQVSTGKTLAWDCGTGNGQMAKVLASRFEKVYATDISENQLLQATKLSNITYKIERAEQCSLPEHSVNLITGAQAVHWFNFEAFYAQVNRVLKPDGILALIGYGLLSVDTETNPIIEHFYKQVVGPYWDQERRYLDEAYQTIPFPFDELKTPYWTYTTHWNLEEMIGYLSTWSAVQHYKKEKGKDPIEEIYPILHAQWKNIKPVSFPILTRIGKSIKSKTR